MRSPPQATLQQKPYPDHKTLAALQSGTIQRNKKGEKEGKEVGRDRFRNPTDGKSPPPSTMHQENNHTRCVAEREGFEPSRRLPAYTRSRRAPSTTRPPLLKTIPPRPFWFCPHQNREDPKLFCQSFLSTARGGRHRFEPSRNRSHFCRSTLAVPVHATRTIRKQPTGARAILPLLAICPRKQPSPLARTA